MKRSVLFAAMILSAAMTLSGCGAASDAGKLDPRNPVTVTIWNYYSGDQLDSFNALVDEFNQGKGKELGVIVSSVNQGSLDDLESALIAAAEKKVGSDEVPNMFPAYTDMAYEMDQRGLVQDISAYFTDEEKAEYIDGYITEGEFSGDGSLKIMPVAKATEVFVLNETDWEKFAEATGADKADLETIEGLVATAKAYYEWTDSLTEEPDDGKAFFGRDAMANYMLIGARQLGVEIIGKDEKGKDQVNFDKEAARKLWDNYYVPFVHGYFSAIGRFRSDDLKTGNVIAYVGSSSGATFTPDTVTREDNSTYSIETGVYAAPEFAESEKIAVQQGAGMVVTTGDEQQIRGSVEFLRWFTDTEQNIDFAVGAGYLPVKKEANDFSLMKDVGDQQKEIVTKTLKVAVDTVNSNMMYTTMPIQNGSSVRNILEYALSDKAAADRAEIEGMLASGSSMDEAVAAFDNDDNFETWYNETLQKLEAVK